MARKPRNNTRTPKRRSNQHDLDSDQTSDSPNYMGSIPVEPPPVHINKAELREGSIQRAKDRPIRERILSFFRKDKDKDYKELIINTEALERRVARIENGILQGFDVERLDEDRMVGAIFKGKVQNLEPGLKAAFVDAGDAYRSK